MTLGTQALTFTIKPYIAFSHDKHAALYQVWAKQAPIPLDRLMCVQFAYVTFDGRIRQDGHMIVLDAVAPFVLKIFQTLFDRKFPLHSAQPIEVFAGDDQASMHANNSSAFNARQITHGHGLPSLHAYGLAIDINPMQNPFVFFASDKDKSLGHLSVHPENSAALYLNRHRAQTDQLPGLCEDIRFIFAENGFTIWGGDWNDPIDWHHFQTTRALAELLTIMQPKHAKQFFELFVHSLASPHSLILTAPDHDKTFITLYQNNPQKFITTLSEKPHLLTNPTRDAGLKKLSHLFDK